MAALACTTACHGTASGTSVQEKTTIGVFAETPIGQVPMPLFGNVQRSGDMLAIASKPGGAYEVDWGRLPKALRILKRAGAGNPPMAGDELSNEA